MAKRRNLKKEKALRNQAYARKFRKRSGSGRFGRRQYNNSNRQESSSENQNEENQETNSNSDSAAASD